MGWSRPDEESRADHYRDSHKHEWRPGDPMTDGQIAAELTRIEIELHEAAAKGQAACKEAMTIIEAMMNDIGIPFAKGSTDA